MFLENHYFLADANVLIDLVQVDGLSILTKLGQVEVLDIVLAECLYPDQIQNKIPNAFLNALISPDRCRNLLLKWCAVSQWNRRRSPTA